MNQSLTTKIAHRFLRHLDALRMRLSTAPLTTMTLEEAALANELRAKIDALSLPNSEGMSPAQRAWNDNMHTLRAMVESRDPRTFLSWDVVAGTMFVKYAKYSRTEYAYIRQRNDWERWKTAIVENKTGNPPRCPFNRSTSCNLVHHAYHVARFEEQTRERAETFDYVFEFGGGYGSMCRLFHNLGFKGRYLILDLPAFSALQEYYLKSIGVPVITEELFADGVSGVLCTSDIDTVGRLIGGKKSLFLATWSISESPLSVREKVLGKIADAFDAYLIAYQPKFEDVDNAQYFGQFRLDHQGYSWVIEAMSHLKNQTYLFGRRGDSR